MMLEDDDEMGQEGAHDHHQQQPQPQPQPQPQKRQRVEGSFGEVEGEWMERRNVQDVRSGNLESAAKLGLTTGNAVDCFEALFFSETFLTQIVMRTNEQLKKADKKVLKFDEFRLFLGLILRFYIHHNLSLVEVFSANRSGIEVYPNLSQYMPLTRFDEIAQNLTFSLGSDALHSARDMISLEEVIREFNENRAKNMTPGSVLVMENDKNGNVTNEIRRLFGEKDMNVDTQLIFDGSTGICCQMALSSPPVSNKNFLENLLGPFEQSGRTVIVKNAMLHMSLKESAKVLKDMGLYMIGLVGDDSTSMSSSSTFPISMIQNHTYDGDDGPSYGLEGELTCDEGKFPVFLTGWKNYGDNEVKILFSSCGSMTIETDPIPKLSEWAQVPVLTPQNLKMNKTMMEYYRYAPITERHEVMREKHLGLNAKFTSSSWDMRLLVHVMGICTIDAYLAHTTLTRGGNGFNMFMSDLITSFLSRKGTIPPPPPLVSTTIESTDLGTPHDHIIVPLVKLNKQRQMYNTKYPQVRCRDECESSEIDKKTGQKRRARATKYCLLCTYRKTPQGKPIEREYIHSVCNQCEATHRQKAEAKFLSAPIQQSNIGGYHNNIDQE